MNAAILAVVLAPATIISLQAWGQSQDGQKKLRADEFTTCLNTHDSLIADAIVSDGRVKTSQGFITYYKAHGQIELAALEKERADQSSIAAANDRRTAGQLACTLGTTSRTTPRSTPSP